MKIIKFEAEWCKPCQTLSKLLEKVKPQFPEIEFSSCNVDTNQDMVQMYGVRNIPTLIFIKEGKEVVRRAGCPTEQALLEFCKEGLEQ